MEGNLIYEAVLVVEGRDVTVPVGYEMTAVDVELMLGRAGGRR